MQAAPALLLLILCAAPAAAQDADKPSSRLIMPDGSVVPLPPGLQGFGTDGPEAVPPPPVAEEPAAPPKPPLSLAERRKQQLDELYDRLAKAKDAQEAGAIGAMIAQTLLRSGSDTADLVMQRAVTAMEAKDYPTATNLLDKAITLQPGWAEAWNKRATVRYLADDDTGSMADIGHVLALEPRHFGALSGMGLILHRNGEDKAALTVLRRAAGINPQDPQVKTMVDELAHAVEGSEL